MQPDRKHLIGIFVLILSVKMRVFEISRQQKKTINDADRLRKYLDRFGLDWKQVRGW